MQEFQLGLSRVSSYFISVFQEYASGNKGNKHENVDVTPPVELHYGLPTPELEGWNGASKPS